MKIQVELNLEDVFEEAMYNEATLKEEFTSRVGKESKYSISVVFIKENSG